MSGTALLAAALGLGPAIWATQQPGRVLTLAYALILGQAVGAYLRMRVTAHR